MAFSDAFLAALEAERSETVPLLFMALTHPDLDEPIRIVHDAIDYQWDGHLWRGIRFDGELLSDDDNQARAELKIQNVDRRASEAISSLTGRIPAEIWLLSSDDFDESTGDLAERVPRQPLGTPFVEYHAAGVYIRDIRVNSLEISGTLSVVDLRTAPYTRYSASQSIAPALFLGP